MEDCKPRAFPLVQIGFTVGIFAICIVLDFGREQLFSLIPLKNLTAH